jgi:hypothetical protein
VVGATGIEFFVQIEKTLEINGPADNSLCVPRLWNQSLRNQSAGLNGCHVSVVVAAVKKGFKSPTHRVLRDSLLAST